MVGCGRWGSPACCQGARSCWLGHGERSAVAVAVNDAVAAGELAAPVLFTRDHLDAAGMTHPRIGTEAMLDGSDGVSDWPLLDAMLLSASPPGGAELVAEAHAAGLAVFTWTCRPENAFLTPAFRRGDDDAAFGDYRAEWGVLRDAGIDGVFVDHADLGVASFG